MNESLAPRVAVIGNGECDQATTELARSLGRRLAEQGFALVTGGLAGVMAAACQGALEAGGHTIGILPGADRSTANAHVEVALATGLGPMRNYLVVLNADLVVAVEGAWGTLSEIALAKKIGRPVVAIGRWASVEGLIPAAGVEEAVARVCELTRSIAK